MDRDPAWKKKIMLWIYYIYYHIFAIMVYPLIRVLKDYYVLLSVCFHQPVLPKTAHFNKHAGHWSSRIVRTFCTKSLIFFNGTVHPNHKYNANISHWHIDGFGFYLRMFNIIFLWEACCHPSTIEMDGVLFLVIVELKVRNIWNNVALKCSCERAWQIIWHAVSSDSPFFDDVIRGIISPP